MPYIPSSFGNNSSISTNYSQTSATTLQQVALNVGRTSVRGSGVVINNVLVPYVPIVFTELKKPTYVQEKHISVIRKGPTAPPTLEMFSYTRKDMQDDGALGFGSIDISLQFDGLNTDFTHAVIDENGAYTGEVISGFYNNTKLKKLAGDEFTIPTPDNTTDLIANDTIVISLDYFNSFGVKQTATARAIISNVPGNGNPIVCVLLTNAIGFPIITDQQDIYIVELVQEDPMFELKFPKFAYRYKYEDGEYSVFSPWSQIAFIPDEFDFMPKKGYNLGMTNRLRSLKILDWVPKNIPKDVTQVDLLFKQSNSPNVYTVESFKKDDVPLIEGTLNNWNTPGTGANFGNYTVESELIHATVASNQMLRPWDNVPRVALAQEITANRLVFANYIQNYDTVDHTSSPPSEIKPMFDIIIDYTNIDDFPELVRLPGKSLKSMRSYQLGVVYRDRYGRETPVMTSNSGTFKVKKESAKNYNRIEVGLSSEAPDWAESFTIYIKETANEYYNLAMDRWYDAEDGGIWVSFPSSERNKINDDTILYLKKQHDSDVPVDAEIEYKVISIKNNAPTFIKTDKQYWGGVPMMLPPANWGTKGRPGTWQSGMFGATGLPLQGRLYLDVYAEYAEQTILEGLKTMTRDGLEVRITQSAGQLTAYNAAGVITQNKSNWYGVSRISFIGEEVLTYTESYTNSSTGITTEVEKEESNAKHPLIRITLDKVMQADMAFTEPADNLDLARGLALEVRNSRVLDRSQFEGRFFVKLYRSNDLVRNIIAPSDPVGDKLFVKESKGVKYLCDAHPGVQDWSNLIPYPRSRTAIQQLPDFKTNYIMPGMDIWQGIKDSNGVPEGAGAIPFSTTSTKAFNFAEAKLGSGQDPDVAGKLAPYEVSSYSAAARGAGYSVPTSPGISLAPNGNCYPKEAGGVPVKPYDGANEKEHGCWPFSPGPEQGYPLGPDSNLSAGLWLGSPVVGGGIGGWANKDGFPSWYGNRYIPHTDNHGQTPGSSPVTYDWPSVVPSQWIPAQWIGNFRGRRQCSGAGGGSFDVHPNCAELDGNNNGYIPFPLGAESSAPDTFDWGVFSSKQVAVNPWMKPAIWGDSPFSLNAWKLEVDPYNNGGAEFGRNGSWSYDTMGRLNRDWMGYWKTGDGSDDTEWPYVQVNWDRWFIDKVGAAENYAGAGIWDDDSVSHMAISYWGIGSNTKPFQNDGFDLSYEQESELTFANFLGTVGTMFRFKQDPDKTVYTITDVNVEKVFNYEGFHGSWGYMKEDSDGLPIASGHQSVPPIGPRKTHPMGLANRHMFYSDLWQSPNGNLVRENSGHAMQNRRLRFNLVLDKKIGLGPAQFHPITRHVGIKYDADGVEDGYECNIPTANGVRDRVPYDKTAANHVGLEKGGTPCPLGQSSNPVTWSTLLQPHTGQDNARFFMYNLASYWNAGDLTLLDQVPGTGFFQPSDPDHAFYTNANNATGDSAPRIGLHERGLNETTIEIVDWYDGEEADQHMSSNPAVFETEPREDVGMDLYYAASPSYPVNLKRYRFDTDGEAGFYDYGLRGEEFVPVGSIASVIDGGQFSQVDGVEENRIWVNEPLTLLQDGTTPDGSGGFIPASKIKFTTKGEGTYYGIGIDNSYTRGVVSKVITDKIFEIEPDVHSQKRSLGYFNCYSFGNGVESNRIRDDYNAITIDKGVKVSAPLAEGYEEERKASSFIFSGIYNSTSGVNRTNQFVQAEPITKDLNPINGSIQKLFARDTDLVTFCENKVFKVLAKKDALFNADGNKNVTSNQAVLGATIPFEGEYGMSRNPESFASESYRVYFTDKDRGAVLRLSKSGLRPISDKGMRDWFKDNLMNSSSLIGSYDNRNDQYNLTIETKDQDNRDNAFTLSFSEEKNGGWTSFKSFIQQGGLTYKNKYYTFPSNKFNAAPTAVGSTAEKLYGTAYGSGTGVAEIWQHYVDLDFHRYSASEVKGLDTITISAGSGAIVVGMNVEGNGVPIDTVVIPGGFGGSIKLSNPIHVEQSAELRFTSARNNFYNFQSHSMVRTVFNGDKGTVKRFKSLNYDGSQGKSLANTSDNYNLHLDGSTVNVGQVYNNNYAKKGWEVAEIKTDLQDGSVKQFIDKENKWFNYINGKVDVVNNVLVPEFGDDVDTAEFSAQGLGFASL